jgi:biotin carboxylase
VKTVLFVGAGRHQRRAILRAKELGLRVVAVDRNPDAPGLAAADAGEAIDFTDVTGVTHVARRHGVDGVLTVSADRAVPVVAAVAEVLGLPGIGADTAHLMTHKIAMRRTLADAGVPQPRFAGARDMQSARAALDSVGVPAVLKPVDSGGQRGIFYVESRDELDGHVHAALAESPTEEAIVESFHDGLELNGIVIARGGEAFPLTLSDRLRPPGVGFGVGWIHVYPASIYADVLAEAERVAVHAVHALGLRDGIAFPQLIVSDDGSVRVVEVAARIPGGQMADLVRHAVGVDLVEVALRQALGEEIPDKLVLPQFEQPLAIRFLTAQPGPLPTGKVLSVGSLEPVLAAKGVVQADTYLQVGETIRPVRLDGDRRGYVIAIADTTVEALQRAEDAARLLEVVVEWTRPQLEATWAEHLEASFPEASDDALVDLAEYDGYVAGLVQSLVEHPGDALAFPLNVNNDLTRRIHRSGNVEAIAYIDRLNRLVEIARGVHEAEAEPG